MKIEIVGIKDTKFKNQETGEVVEGQSVYFEYEDECCVGYMTDKVFLPTRKKLTPVPHIPCEADLYYNKYGKVDEIKIRK